MRIDVKWRREGGVAIASVLGRIDNASADEFRSLVEEGLSTDDDFLFVDMEKVAFMSSAGLRACLILARKAGRGKFALCSLTQLNREVVAISGFDQLIPVHESQAAAMDAVGSS
ncbi:MAG: STAS domain-containing protein [Gammaproteobacteria bacterium]|nr:STAS domain-containing protein [Gammaproteobacteria bacterium]MYC51650.1 STAS domain-containing protein [Gammaproteobacteria bacterium]